MELVSGSGHLYVQINRRKRFKIVKYPDLSYTEAEAEMNKIGDKTATNDAARAMLTFLKIFPEFERRPFYITGESYAGKYVPRLMRKLSYLRPFDTILKGVAIGNGYFR